MTDSPAVPPAAETSLRLERGVAALLLGVLAIGCLLVLRPFLAAILGAGILVFATWPILESVRARLRFGDGAAAGAMVLVVFLVLVAPLVFVVAGFADDARSLLAAARAATAEGLPGPPDFVASIPLIGTPIAAEWRRLAAETADLQSLLAPYAEAMARWSLDAGVSIGTALAQGVLELAIALFVAFFLWRDGEGVAQRVAGGLARLAGARGERLLGVAAQTVRNVVYGVLGTALVQGFIILVGLLIAGVPNAILLGFFAAMASPIPVVGPAIVWLPAVLWLIAIDHTTGAIVLGAAGIAAAFADNVLRPILIARGGGDTPIAIVFLGVLGGLLAFGFLGLFLGPALLALAFMLLKEWTQPAP